MVNQQLLDYIKQQLQQGVSQKQIKSYLMANGRQAQDIEDAFAFIQNPSGQVPTPTQTITSLLGATAIFGQALAIYKQRLGTFLGIMIIPMLMMVVPAAVLADSRFSNIIISLLSPKLARGEIGLLILSAILFFVIIIIPVIIIPAWGQAALVYAIKDRRERIGVVESYRRGWHKIISYWWVSLLTTFITLGGFLLLIVPGIIFAVWFSLAIFILIAEDLKGMSALLKSKEYVKGKWGGVFWRFFFIMLVSLLISLVPILIFTILKVPFGSEISKFIIGLFLLPLLMTYSFLVYSNLKALKDEIAFEPTSGKKAAFIFVGILGILLIPAILLSTVFLNSAREKAYDTRRQAETKQIQAALEMYYSEHGNYPFLLNELTPKYLPSMPIDPSTNQPYQFQLQPNGTEYKICSQLESTKTQKCASSQF